MTFCFYRMWLFRFLLGGDFAVRAGATPGFAGQREDRARKVEQGCPLGRHRDREGEIRTRNLEAKKTNVEETFFSLKLGTNRE